LQQIALKQLELHSGEFDHVILVWFSKSNFKLFVYCRNSGMFLVFLFL